MPDQNEIHHTFSRPHTLLAGALICVGFALGAVPTAGYAAPIIPDTPLIATQSSIPLTMLTVGRDHTLFYEAYNDASDIDGDGTLDIRFKPSITYYGLFDSTLCYQHSNGNKNSDKFTPVASAGESGKCSGYWSGNWLNYATTSRIDALRKVFYGGYREVDTASQTILRRAYIPQDAHSWAKEYTSEAVDGYKISDYTPYSAPKSGKHHFFGNLTATNGVNCSNLDDCSNRPPLLRVIPDRSERVWQWASSERPVLNNIADNHTKEYTVRVEVCTASFHGDCKAYGSGWKPIGLLQEYGENEAMLFGLLTGSYNKNMSGGVLRKVVSSFKNEVKASDGTFTSDASIVKALNALRIRDYNNGRTDNSYRGGWLTTAPMSEGDFVDWGNPIGEISYETLRYFAGKKFGTAAFKGNAPNGHDYDADVGLPKDTWDDPYSNSSAAKASWCAKPNMLIVSGINPSFDSDQLPGSYFNGDFSGDLSDLNVSSIASTITENEAGVTGQHYIGQSASNYDGAPTGKQIDSLGNIRGLAPEDPTKQGSYYVASVAEYGKVHGVREIDSHKITVDTYAVVLSSPLPHIEIPVGGKTITLVPFAKSVSGSGISNTKGNFQPTNQIVDFYVDTLANSSAADADDNINGGRYYAKFRINFEDVEQGADHDMDAITVYEISVQADGRIRVVLTPEYQAGGIKQNMGYVISGTTKDGVYLVVQDENGAAYYYLNVPQGDGYGPGSCDVSNPSNTLKTACSTLPNTYDSNNHVSERYFSPGDSAATLLNNPLWYAAKWGGFVDSNDNNKPDQTVEWDADGDGVPDNYFLVQNPLKLKEALKKSFDTIVQRSASAGNITSNGQQLQTQSRVFQTQFSSGNWEGEVLSYKITSSGVSGVADWKASEQLPLPASRNIVTWNTAANAGVDFVWSSLSSTQRTALGSQDILEYLRGSQQNEQGHGGSLRTRSVLLGDFVDSSPYYVNDTDTVYVGGNDGMLHAFAATTGKELFAYIPALVFSKLKNLASPEYTHTYYVDGDMSASTRDQTANKNILVASTGRGAKGLFALDVTDPTSFSAGKALWEYDGSNDPDFGYVLGRPQIGILTDGTPAVFVGNGHASNNGNAVLYVFNLKTGDLIKRIDTKAGGDNGMSTPTLLDSDNDGYVDTVYAGDLKGNVWRFDVSGNSSQWKSYYGSGNTPKPFFTAIGPDGNAQPINAQITVVTDTLSSDVNYGKRFLFFGTGSYVYTSDTTDTSVQSWYGLIDNDAVISDRSKLVQRTIEATGTVGDYSARTFSESQASDMEEKSGWYVDLDLPKGERIVTRSILYSFLEPVLIASSIIPNSDPCEAGGSGYVNAINPYTGARLAYPPFDLNGDGQFDESDMLDGENISSFNPDVGMPSEPTVVGDRLVVGGSTGAIADVLVNTGSSHFGRLSWREIKGN